MLKFLVGLVYYFLLKVTLISYEFIKLGAPSIYFASIKQIFLKKNQKYYEFFLDNNKFLPMYLPFIIQRQLGLNIIMFKNRIELRICKE